MEKFKENFKFQILSLSEKKNKKNWFFFNMKIINF